MNKKILGLLGVVSTMVITACGPTSAPTSTPNDDPTSSPTSEPASAPSFVAPESISIFGTVGEGTAWETDYDLTSSDDGKVWTISEFKMNSGEEWKIRKNHSSNDTWGYSSLNDVAKAIFEGTDSISVKTSGLYTVTFNAETCEIGASLDNEFYTMKIVAPKEYAYIGDNPIYTVEFSNPDVKDKVNWSSSDESVAKVDEYGIVKPLKVGTTTLTVTNKSNKNIAPATYELTVKDVAVKKDGVDDYTDLSGIYSEEPVVTFTQNKGDGFPSAETFSQVELNVPASKKYYAKATFSQSKDVIKWVWSRVGLVNKEPGNSFSRGLYFSSADNNNKMILTENPNGWGATTDRNQYWNFLAEHDFSNCEIELLRDGNNFYYWINGQLICSESINTVFADKDTVPAISFVDSNGYVKNMYATTDEALVNEQLARVPSKGFGFWGSYEENVVVNNTEGTIEFKNNNNQWPFDNIKDNAAFAIGDMGHAAVGKKTTYSFDVTFTDFGVDPDSAYLALSFKPYNNPNDGIRTLMVNKYRNGVNGWGWNGGCSNALNESTDFESPIVTGECVKVTITRDPARGWVQNVKGVEKVWPWDETGTEFIPMFNAYRCSVKVSNITVTVE